MSHVRHHSISGEAVFQTGMCGYVESLTDPSYRGQILVLTYPLVGKKVDLAHATPNPCLCLGYTRIRFLVPRKPLIPPCPVAACSGNYGVPSEDEKDADGLLSHFESSEIHASALVISTLATQYSHWNARESLESWMERKGVACRFFLPLLLAHSLPHCVRLSHRFRESATSTHAS